MKKFLISGLVCSLLAGCGSVAPVEQIKNSKWKTYNHKTTYAVKEVSNKVVYLTVKYSSYTFLDKSAEMVPTAKTVFDKLAHQLAKERDYVGVRISVIAIARFGLFRSLDPAV
ncbi:hypothetical protein, partial [Vibrio zhanjiangensis]|uniref:hypothetical protein n=1 Tax=Vibrio zhanjiangensis TaxID=1046128 RepID=UPI0024E12EBC